MQKLYYSISEVAKIVSEPQYVLRYWEKEFPLLKPKKNRAGNRIYSDKDLEIVLAIKTMLREQKLSTKGVLNELCRIFDKPNKSAEKSLKIESKRAVRNVNQEQTLFKEFSSNKIILQEIRDSLMKLLDIAKNL